MNSRRKFLRNSTAFAAGVGLIGIGCGSETDNEATAEVVKKVEPFFNISLAQWSLNKQLFGGEIDNLDFARVTKEDYGINAVEYVNAFFKDKATDMDYLRQMNQRAKDNDVEQLLIMIDGEGGLGDTDDAARKTAVENHHKWVDAARFLGCHSIRVNAYGEGAREDVAKAAIDGLGQLSEYAKQRNMNVIVENHGGYSSDGSWLANVMSQVNMDNCGTLPDFGNFCIKRSEAEKWEDRVCLEEYDRYKGIEEMMPYAKAVSAKSHDFNEAGDEIHSDYMRIMQIVKDAGYRGWVGIEYEGSKLDAPAGIRATKALLERVGKELS